MLEKEFERGIKNKLKSKEIMQGKFNQWCRENDKCTSFTECHTDDIVECIISKKWWVKHTYDAEGNQVMPNLKQ